MLCYGVTGWVTNGVQSALYMREPYQNKPLEEDRALYSIQIEGNIRASA